MQGFHDVGAGTASGAPRGGLPDSRARHDPYPSDKRDTPAERRPDGPEIPGACSDANDEPDDHKHGHDAEVGHDLTAYGVLGLRVCVCGARALWTKCSLLRWQVGKESGEISHSA